MCFPLIHYTIFPNVLYVSHNAKIDGIPIDMCIQCMRANDVQKVLNKNMCKTPTYVWTLLLSTVYKVLRSALQFIYAYGI